MKEKEKIIAMPGLAQPIPEVLPEVKPETPPEPFSFLTEATKTKNEVKSIDEVIVKLQEYNGGKGTPEPNLDETMMIMEDVRKTLFNEAGLEFKEATAAKFLENLLRVYAGVSGAARLLRIEDMISPINWQGFSTITEEEHGELIQRASQLYVHKDASPSLKAHCLSILKGNIPFGWVIYKGYYEGPVSDKLLSLLHIMEQPDNEVMYATSSSVVNIDKEKFLDAYAPTKDEVNLTLTGKFFASAGLTWDIGIKYPLINNLLETPISLENIFFTDQDATARKRYMKIMAVRQKKQVEQAAASTKEALQKTADAEKVKTPKVSAFKEEVKETIAEKVEEEKK